MSSSVEPLAGAVTGELERKPPWLKVQAPRGERYVGLKTTLRRLKLHTVCEEARCPNVGECWGAGTATVMLLGDTCTRGCRFCAVKTGNPRGAVDASEPENTARAICELGLRYVVLTMVDRDDLPDGGAAHVAETVRALRRGQPALLVEALTGDFRGSDADIDAVLASSPDVFAHNLEVTRGVTRRVRDVRCTYDLSLSVLEHASASGRVRFVKSSLMVGIGESDDDVVLALRDLRQAGVSIVTIGQYLRPTPRHAPVRRWVEPGQFEEFARIGHEIGFSYVASGPLVRSSYHAAEAFVLAELRPGTGAGHGSGEPALPAERPGLIPGHALVRHSVRGPG